MSDFGIEKIDAADQAKRDQLWKMHLKTPGVLPGSLVNILRKNYVSPANVHAVRIAWHERFGKVKL